MKLKKIFALALASVVLLAGCEHIKDSGDDVPSTKTTDETTIEETEETTEETTLETTEETTEATTTVEETTEETTEETAEAIAREAVTYIPFEIVASDYLVDGKLVDGEYFARVEDASKISSNEIDFNEVCVMLEFSPDIVDIQVGDVIEMSFSEDGEIFSTTVTSVSVFDNGWHFVKTDFGNMFCIGEYRSGNYWISQDDYMYRYTIGSVTVPVAADVQIYDNQFVTNAESLDELVLSEDLKTMDDFIDVLDDEGTWGVPEFYIVVENGEITKMFLNPNPHQAWRAGFSGN